jgi:hypothetical protein
MSNPSYEDIVKLYAALLEKIGNQYNIQDIHIDALNLLRDNDRRAS